MALPYTHSQPFRHWQRRIFVIAWLTYASFYLCRVNFSVALPVIQSDLGWSRSTAGLIGSVFLWVYALGQLLNGTLGQKADARWFVGTGMLASAVCNAAFGAASWPWTMALIWGANGWAQSMGWGAIIKTIAAWFGPRRRGRIAALFSPCFVAGHLAAWAAGGWLASQWGWRYAFWLPAIVVAAMAGVWLVGIRSTPQAAGFPSPGQHGAQRGVTVREILGSILAEPRLRWAALTCAIASMIQHGLTLWAPTLLVDSLRIGVSSAAVAASILPLLGLVGASLAGWMSDRYHRSREAPGIVILSLLIALAMVGFLLSGNRGGPWASITLLGLCGVAVYGINTLLLASLPLSFGQEGRAAAVAGFLDFASYIGGGLSAFIVGQLLDGPGWTAVYVYWLVGALVTLWGAVQLGRRTSR